MIPHKHNAYTLMLSMPGKIFIRLHTEILFLYFPENSWQSGTRLHRYAYWSWSHTGHIWFKVPASVAQLDAPSDWRPGGRRFNPRQGRQHSFVEIDREIFSTVILSLPLIQEGELLVSGERMCTILVNCLEDYACPVNVWLGKLTTLDMTPLGWLSRKTSTQTNKVYF